MSILSNFNKKGSILNPKTGTNSTESYTQTTFVDQAAANSTSASTMAKLKSMFTSSKNNKIAGN